MLDCNMTILKIEGLGDLSNAQILIYNDSELIDRASPTSSVPQIIRLGKQHIKLLLIDTPSSLPVCSVSFDLSIFEHPGFHWLPLFLTEEDSLSSVPEEVGLPRILLDINPAILTPVLEMTESSDTVEENIDDIPTDDYSKVKTKNMELMIKVMDLENELNTARKNFEEEVESIDKGYKEKISVLLRETEKMRMVQAKHAKNYADLLVENQSYISSLGEMQKEKNDLFDKLERYERLYEDVKLREDSILMLLEEKDKEIMKVLKRKSSLDVCGQGSITIIPKNVIKAQIENGESMSGRFRGLESIDRRIKNTLKILNLEGMLRLADEFIYLMGGKKVNVLMKKDLVYVKSGAGNVKTLEAFISNNCAQDIQTFLAKRKVKEAVPVSHKRSNSNSGFSGLPNSIISRTFDTKKNLQKSFPKALEHKNKSFSPLNKTHSYRNV